MNVTFWAAYFCLYKNQTRVNTDIIKKISTAWLSKKKCICKYHVLCNVYTVREHNRRKKNK